MKRTVTILLLGMLFLFNFMPYLALAADQASLPTEPYEKVVAKNGSWYSDRITYDNSAELVVGYTGAYQIDDSLYNEKPNYIALRIKEDIVLRGIYLPYVNTSIDPIYLQLEDSKGNIYGPYEANSAPVNRIKEISASDDDMTYNNMQDNVSYFFIPENDIILQRGDYKLTVSNTNGLVRNKDTGVEGAFLIKGVNYSAYEKYMVELREWGIENNPNITNEDVESATIGEKDFNEDYSGEQEQAVRNPAAFSLETDSLIEEIVLNTFNNGKGATPGIISLLDETGEIIVAYQAYGGQLGNIPNGVWIVDPNIILPPGNYYIGVSDPDVLTYDSDGYPEFYLTASLPLPIRYDFTGTYIIDLDTYKTSTLMGPVNEQTSSFSLKDFELTILDKDGELELIGKYEGMPFSQGCTILEETENKVVAQFDFSADLTKLPTKTLIGAGAIVTLTKPENGPAQFDMTGTATYERAASEDKGADYNTYSLQSAGFMKQKELPPFVMTALGKAGGGVGNIPGPDNSVETAIGLLFPPLVGLVVHVLQELLKPKQKTRPTKAKKYSKEWYKVNNPGLTEEQLAMLMLADAMGNTDNPDEGDAESIGDNEQNSSSNDSAGNDDGDYTDYNQQEEDNSYNDDYSEDSDEETNEAEEQILIEDEDLTTPSESEEQLAHGHEMENPVEQEPLPTEPETLVLQTDYKGGTTEYVKDLETGEWVNPETGGVLDLELYEKVVKPNFEKDKEFIEAEWEKNVKGETAFDKELKEGEAERKAKLAQEEYIQRIEKRHGTTDREELNRILNERQAQQAQNAKDWNRLGDIADAGEKISTGIVIAADTAVDGLANVTGPAGKTIRAVYKVTKGATSAMAEKGSNLENFIGGSIKGGADAATDFIDNKYIKSAVTIAGEATGGAIIDGEKGFKDGLVDGTFKVITGAITDKAGGDGFGEDVSTMALKNGKTRIVISSKDKLIGRTVSSTVADKFISQKNNAQWAQSAVKGAGGFIDEFGLKPAVTQPIKDSYQ